MAKELAARRWALGVLAALLAVAVLWMTWGSRAPSRIEGRAGGADEVHAASPPIAAIADEASDRAASAAEPSDGETSPASAAAAQPIAAANALELLVLRRADHEPVDGARIAYLALPLDRAPADDPETWFREGVLEQRVEPAAELFAAGSDGLVLVPRPTEAAIVIASGPGSFAYAVVNSTTRSPHRLMLVRDFDVPVEVVDLEQRPVAGARVVLHWGLGERANQPTLFANTDAGGKALLRHVGLVFGRHAADFKANVALAAPHLPPVVHELDPQAVPEQAVRLVMPACGAVDVEITDRAGNPYLGEVDVVLTAATAVEVAEHGVDVDRQGMRVERARGPRVAFEHVGLGSSVIARVHRHGSYVSTAVSAPGPMRAGERATIRVGLDEKSVAFTGRLLDRDGAPIARREVYLAARLPNEPAPNHYPGGGTVTDEQGRFECDAPPNEFPDPPFTLAVCASDRAQGFLGMASIERTRRFEPGTHDLGELRIDAQESLASGRVVDADGEPVAGARIITSYAIPDAHDATNVQWHWMWFAQAISAADGSFDVRASLDIAEVRLSASLEGFNSEPKIVRRGATGVELTLAGGGQVFGRLALDPGMVAFVRVMAQRSGTTPPQTTQYAQLDADGGFGFRSLPDGEYSIVVASNATRQRVHAVDGVIVAADRSQQDPRLNPIDLRGRLFKSRLTVLDADGQPANGRARFVSTQPAERWQRNASLRKGAVELVHDGAGYEVLLIVDRHCLQRELVVAADQVVRLRRSPSVRVALTSTLPEGSDAKLIVKLTAQRATDAPRFGEVGDGGEAVSDSPDVGEVEVGLILARTVEGRERSVDLPFKQKIVVDALKGEQRFEFAVDPQALASAVEAVVAGTGAR